MIKAEAGRCGDRRLSVKGDAKTRQLQHVYVVRTIADRRTCVQWQAEPLRNSLEYVPLSNTINDGISYFPGELSAGNLELVGVELVKATDPCHDRGKAIEA